MADFGKFVQAWYSAFASLFTSSASKRETPGEKAMFSLSQTSLKRLKGVRPELAAIPIEAIKTSPVDFGISQGVRTKAEQKAYYAQGREPTATVNRYRRSANLPAITHAENQKKVTWTMESNHLPKADGYGYAFDIVCYVDGKITWEEKYYEQAAEHILKVAGKMGAAVKWGGHWKKPDKPHFEYAGA